ncbi:MAG: Nramp family divalent metal transporter [Chitinophagales bacterium]|nr:Nramp family divalent metal transporter [Chitinophagales bacterium]MDW8393716.1 Nramp family divalent metal transporter [Chitinophagales bacterium]
MKWFGKASTRSLDDVHSSVDTTQRRSGLRSFLAFLGPAYLVSVGYMDPGNWATDIAGGSAFGYSLIWVLLMSNLIAILLQSHCARLGIVRGRDLAQACKESYPRAVQLPLWFLAEIAIAATDLAEVLGFALGLHLLFGLPLLWGVAIAVLDSLLLLMLMHFGIRKLEAFIISLVAVIGFCFFLEIFIAQPDWKEVSSGFIPSLPNELALYIAIGIIGATVMPHNLYLHSALVQTRKIDPSDAGKKRAIRFNLLDSVVALNIAFLVNASILVLAGTVFFKNGFHEITEIQDAYNLLEPLLGTTLAPLAFAIALIASGQASTITGTLSGQIVMEGFLNLRITPWLRRLMTRLIAVVPAFLVIWIKGESELGNLLILSQVILSLQLGFAIIPLIHFVSDRERMGSFAIGLWSRLASWTAALIIVALNLRMVINELMRLQHDPNTPQWVVFGLMLPLALALLLLLLFITFWPLYVKKLSPYRTLHQAVGRLHFGQRRSFERIAIAVDFTAKDQQTIEAALQVGNPKSRYLLIHVVETAGARLVEGETHEPETLLDRQQLDEYALQLSEAGFVVETHLGFGSPRKVIPQIVGLWKAELLVMGAHGHSGIKDLIFGETINAVRHRVNIPVLAAR